MLKKLIQSYTRTSNTQPRYYPCKELFEDEWNYLQTKYGNSLPTVSTHADDDLVFSWEKVGEESIINEFIEEITSTEGRLHNRVLWCQNNNIQFNFIITDV